MYWQRVRTVKPYCIYLFILFFFCKNMNRFETRVCKLCLYYIVNTFCWVLRL